MRSQTLSEKPNWQHAAGSEMRSVDSYPATVSPNSSTVIAITTVADLQDVLAVLRTAALFARNFGTKLSIDVLGSKNLVIDPADDNQRLSLKKLLDPIQAQLRETVPSDTGGFVLEANLTAASFLSVSNISVRVHTGESDQRRR